jgi:hypothetical protein
MTAMPASGMAVLGPGSAVSVGIAGWGEKERLMIVALRAAFHAERGLQPLRSRIADGAAGH